MTSATTSATPLRLGAVAYDPKAVTIWETIKTYLTDEASVAFDFVLFSNYEAQVEALFAGWIDVAWNTPTAYVRCEHRHAGASQVLAMRDTDCGFASVLVCPVGSSIQGLADLRGRTVAVGSRDSAQAAILPIYHLAQAGLSADADYKLRRFDSDLGKHGDTGSSELDVIRSVEAGESDAGALAESLWKQLATGPSRLGDRLRAVWTSPPFSHCNFTALPTLAEPRWRPWTNALLAMDFENPRHRRALELEGLRRWLPGSKAGYADLTAAMKQQGLLA